MKIRITVEGEAKQDSWGKMCVPRQAALELEQDSCSVLSEITVTFLRAFLGDLPMDKLNGVLRKELEMC